VLPLFVNLSLRQFFTFLELGSWRNVLLMKCPGSF
jgi:hypothetical protein